MKEKQILVVIKKPGEAPKVEPLFDNTLEALQSEVGGKIDQVTICSDLVAIVNRECLDLPYNCTFANMPIFGPVLFVGANKDQFTSLKAATIPMILRELGGRL